MTQAAAPVGASPAGVLVERVRSIWAARVEPTAARIARPLRIVTGLGWVLLLVVLVAVVVVFALDWVEFAAMGLVAGLVLMAAVPFVLGRSTYAVQVDLASTRVTVGDRAAGRVLVRNAASRPARAAHIELPVGATYAEFRLPRLQPGAEHDDPFTIPTERRAVLTLGPVTSVRADPIGVLRRVVSWTEPMPLFVHPRIVSLSSDTTGFLRDLEGLPTRDLADDDVAFHALREYTPGDDLRHVHWKSTARAGELMIRQFEQTRRSHLLIGLSNSSDDYLHPEEFELAVSVAGSIGASAFRDGKAVTIITPAGRIRAATATQLLDGLSAIEFGDAMGGIDAIARSAGRLAPAASVVVFITGRETSASTIRTASSRIPATARAFCLRAEAGGVLARQSIGDVATVTVPGLDALGVAMRAVAA